jgi:WD40 repeat protein
VSFADGIIKGIIKVWNVATGEEVLTMQEEPTRIGTVAWSPDGKYILAVKIDAEEDDIVIWDTTTGEKHLTLMSGHESFRAGWSPDSARIASTGWDGVVKVWDANTGDKLLTFTGHEDETWDVAWSPDGKMIASTDGVGSARIWDAETGEELKNLYPEDYGIIIPGVAWSSDGERLVTYAHDGVVKIWDVKTGDELLTLNGPTGWDISWSKDGKQILLASGDNTIRVWNADTGEEIRRYDAGGAGNASWSPDETLIAVHIGREIKVFPAWSSKEDLIAYAHECCLIRELTDTERELFGLPKK